MMQALARGLSAAGRLIADDVSTQATCSARVIQVLGSATTLQYVQLREVKQQATEVRSGQVVDVKGKLMQIQKYQHTQGSGRQLGNVQVVTFGYAVLPKLGIPSSQLFTILSRMLNMKSYDTLEVVRLDDRTFTYLYTEDYDHKCIGGETAGNQLHFMDPQTYEQEAVDMQLFGDQYDFFVEDLEAILSFHDGEAVAGMLPQQVVLSVVTTDTVAKGDEKSPQYKPAIVGSGRKIMVPPFIAQGERIVVDTREGTFVKRAK